MKTTNTTEGEAKVKINKEKQIIILRKGTWPILKYSVRAGDGWYATVMLDDDNGNILVSFDLHAFHHFWPRDSRGTEKLREFLTRGGNDGYVKNKLSYHLSTWNGRKAEAELHKICEEKWGKREDWPHQIEEMYDQVSESTSQDAFYAILHGCEDGMFADEVYPEDFPSGEGMYNVNVERFVDMMWKPLQKFWREELQKEAEAPREENRI